MLDQSIVLLFAEVAPSGTGILTVPLSRGRKKFDASPKSRYSVAQKVVCL
jgi:hypothetical protein